MASCAGPLRGRPGTRCGRSPQSAEGGASLRGEPVLLSLTHGVPEGKAGRTAVSYAVGAAVQSPGTTQETSLSEIVGFLKE